MDFDKHREDANVNFHEMRATRAVMRYLVAYYRGLGAMLAERSSGAGFGKELRERWKQWLAEDRVGAAL